MRSERGSEQSVEYELAAPQMPLDDEGAMAAYAGIRPGCVGTKVRSHLGGDPAGSGPPGAPGEEKTVTVAMRQLLQSPRRGSRITTAA
ncbi:MAG: hypothetical protein ACOC46_00725 [Pirellulales bacterium]